MAREAQAFEPRLSPWSRVDLVILFNGFGASDAGDSDEASHVRAEALITHGGKLYCNGCGRQYQAHKSDFEEHIETDTCP